MRNQDDLLSEKRLSDRKRSWYNPKYQLDNGEQKMKVPEKGKIQRTVVVKT